MYLYYKVQLYTYTARYSCEHTPFSDYMTLYMFKEQDFNTTWISVKNSWFLITCLF